VKLMPCTEHNMENGVCTYCGFTIYLVTYNGNNATSGTVPTDANEYTSGQTVTVLGNTGDLVRTGYTFIGWNTQADGLGTYYAPGATFTITSLVTLYAKWTPITYTITCDLAGGTVATANPTSYTAESAAITLNNPTREGYTFAGWTGTDISGTATTVTIPATPLPTTSTAAQLTTPRATPWRATPSPSRIPPRTGTTSRAGRAPTSASQP